MRSVAFPPGWFHPLLVAPDLRECVSTSTMAAVVEISKDLLNSKRLMQTCFPVQANRITSVMAAYSWFAISVFNLSIPFKLSFASGCSIVLSGRFAGLPLNKELFTGLLLAQLVAMNTMSSLFFSTTIMSNNSCSCEDTVRSSVIISTPQAPARYFVDLHATYGRSWLNAPILHRLPS